MSDAAKMYAIRPANNLCRIVGVTDDPNVVAEEICPECYERGVIFGPHEASEPHRGSVHFRLRRHTGRPSDVSG